MECQHQANVKTIQRYMREIIAVSADHYNTLWLVRSEKSGFCPIVISLLEFKNMKPVITKMLKPIMNKTNSYRQNGGGKTLNIIQSANSNKKNTFVKLENRRLVA